MNLDINVRLLVLNRMLERKTWPQVIVVLLKVEMGFRMRNVWASAT